MENLEKSGTSRKKIVNTNYIKGRAMNATNHKVVRVNAEEFELDNGQVIPHVVELDEDEIPSVEEFQATYDRWRSVIENELKERQDGQTG